MSIPLRTFEITGPAGLKIVVQTTVSGVLRVSFPSDTKGSDGTIQHKQREFTTHIDIDNPLSRVVLNPDYAIDSVMADGTVRPSSPSFAEIEAGMNEDTDHIQETLLANGIKVRDFAYGPESTPCAPPTTTNEIKIRDFAYEPEPASSTSKPPTTSTDTLVVAADKATIAPSGVESITTTTPTAAISDKDAAAPATTTPAPTPAPEIWDREKYLAEYEYRLRCREETGGLPISGKVACRLIQVGMLDFDEEHERWSHNDFAAFDHYVTKEGKYPHKFVRWMNEKIAEPIGLASEELRDLVFEEGREWNSRRAKLVVSALSKEAPREKAWRKYKDTEDRRSAAFQRKYTRAIRKSQDRITEGLEPLPKDAEFVGIKTIRMMGSDDLEKRKYTCLDPDPSTHPDLYPNLLRWNGDWRHYSVEKLRKMRAPALEGVPPVPHDMKTTLFKLGLLPSVEADAVVIPPPSTIVFTARTSSNSSSSSSSSPPQASSSTDPTTSTSAAASSTPIPSTSTATSSIPIPSTSAATSSAHATGSSADPRSTSAPSSPKRPAPSLSAETTEDRPAKRRRSDNTSAPEVSPSASPATQAPVAGPSRRRRTTNTPSSTPETPANRPARRRRTTNTRTHSASAPGAAPSTSAASAPVAGPSTVTSTAGHSHPMTTRSSTKRRATAVPSPETPAPVKRRRTRREPARGPIAGTSGASSSSAAAAPAAVAAPQTAAPAPAPAPPVPGPSRPNVPFYAPLLRGRRLRREPAFAHIPIPAPVAAVPAPPPAAAPGQATTSAAAAAPTPQIRRRRIRRY